MTRISSPDPPVTIGGIIRSPVSPLPIPGNPAAFTLALGGCVWVSCLGAYTQKIGRVNFASERRASVRQPCSKTWAISRQLQHQTIVKGANPVALRSSPALLGHFRSAILFWTVFFCYEAERWVE
eukprot:2850391-Rhodomonas_salina.1